ncbi:MAG: MFS transporter, partial [Chloroflexi bacterium]|nr:MFS transporter [Chloroflexota bacterium]
QLGILLGPAVGGGLMWLLGPAVGLLVNALLYLPLTLWLLTVPYTGHHRQGARVAPRPPMSLWEAPRVLREVSGDRTIVAMVALAGFGSLLVGNAYQAQMPEFVQDLGGDTTGLLYSVLLTANAAGAVVGGLLLEGGNLLRARVRTAILCAILWCVAIGGFAVARSSLLAFALLFVAGACNLAFGAMAQTLVQLRAPAPVRGQVVGVFSMSQQGLRVGSGVTVGVLGSIIGIHWSLGLSALALLLITLSLLAFTRGSEAKP